MIGRPGTLESNLAGRICVGDNGEMDDSSDDRGGASVLTILAALLLSGVCVIGIVVAIALSAFRMAQTPGDATSEKLHLIALALQNYHDAYDSFPPAIVADPSGKPMYSGRVLLLPFLGEQILYSQFDLDQAWDSPQNLPLSQRTVSAFQNPNNFTPLAGQTDSAFVTGNGTIFDPGSASRMTDVVDGASATIAVVEIKASGIGWAEPSDFDLSKPASLPAGEDPRGTWAAFVDGSARRVPRTTSPQQVRGMATRDGGEPKVEF